MRNHISVVLVLVALVLVAGVSAWAVPQTDIDGSGRGVVMWMGYLYVLPLFLAGMLLTGQRWLLMAAVMYGTIGLALDLSTVVHELTQDRGRLLVLSLSLVTGLLNLLLIILGGRAFLALPAPPSQ